jgi:hypothetical protein
MNLHAAHTKADGWTLRKGVVVKKGKKKARKG